MRERLRLREGWSSLGLLLLVLLAMAWSFNAGGLDEGLRILPTVVVLGVLAGSLGAKSRLSGLLAHPLGLATGAACCFLLLGGLIPLPHVDPPLGWPAGFQVRGDILAQRLQAWVAAAMNGEMSQDTLPFVAQMAALTWLMAFYGAWFLFRSHWVWGAILPANLTTFLGVYYAPPRLMIYFVLCLLLSLILVVRCNVFQRERDWQRHHVVYDRHIGLDFVRDGALLSLVVIGLVWLVPRPSSPGRLGDYWQRLQGPWQRVQEEWGRLYASLGYREQTGASAFGRTVTLGGPVTLGMSQVMLVEAPEAHYWRAVVLDRYTGSGWIDTSATTVRRAAGSVLTNWGAYQARKALVQTVTLLRPGQPLLFAAAEPSQVQLATRVTASAPPEQQGLAQGVGLEVSAIWAEGLGRDNRYVVQSLVSTASVQGLHSAGNVYPAWVSQRYLQLPASLPQRVGALARELTRGALTPYGQAVAIEGYLRRLRYNQLIEGPPAGRDAVDWFLFDSQEGYCTYYASAMVLLCRSVGIPARFAQGYAPGEYAEQVGGYVVREADAHAWPEVYFPGYGWIEFEPTPSRPLLTRPQTDEETGPGMVGTPRPNIPRPEERFGPDVPLPPAGDGGDITLPSGATLFSRVLWIELALAGLLLAGGVALSLRAARHWRSLRPVERLYVRLTWAAGAVGVSARPYQTPLELGRALMSGLGPSGGAAGQIVQLYVRERFGGHRVSQEELAAVTRAWRRLRPLVLAQALRRRLSLVRPRQGGHERVSWTELRG